MGGSAGGTSSLLVDVSSNTVFGMTTLLSELDVEGLKGSSLLTFVQKEMFIQFDIHMVIWYLDK